MERSRSSLTVLDETRLSVLRLAEQVEHGPDYSTFHDWHEIGAAGEPAFAGVWVNFDNAVVAERAAFWKDSAGIVRCRGMVKTGTGTIFTLPVGFWPLGTRRFAVVGNGAFARVDVSNLGVVAISVGSGTTHLTLDGIAFRAEK